MADINPYINKVRGIVDYANNFSGNVDRGINDLKGKYGYDKRVKAIEDANNQTYQTEKLLSNLPTNVKRRTSGRGLNAAQLERVTSSERDPLSRQLGEATNQASLARSGVTDINDMIKDFRASKIDERDSVLNAMRGESDALFNQFKSQEQRESEARQLAQRREEMAAQERAAARQAAAQRELMLLQQSLQEKARRSSEAQESKARQRAEIEDKERRAAEYLASKMYGKSSVDDSLGGQLKSGYMGAGNFLGYGLRESAYSQINPFTGKPILKPRNTSLNAGLNTRGGLY